MVCVFQGDNLVFLPRHHHHGSSIAGGLVKGALSVAASAYKALFAGPPVTAQVSVCFLFFDRSQITGKMMLPAWTGKQYGILALSSYRTLAKLLKGRKEKDLMFEDLLHVGNSCKYVLQGEEDTSPCSKDSGTQVRYIVSVRSCASVLGWNTSATPAVGPSVGPKKASWQMAPELSS